MRPAMTWAPRLAVPLRPAVDTDGDALGRLIAACFSEYPGCVFDRPREFPELDAIATHFAAAGGRLWVAEEDGRIVGSLGVRPSPAGVELLKVYVARHRRGTGLARDLLAAAIVFGRERAAAALELWSDTRFTRAHAFYAKHGFERTGERRVLADLSATCEDRFRRAL
jgi:putative acetyltransferase